jgi:hypothetical protein
MFEWHTPIEIMKNGTVREYKGYLINRNGEVYSLLTQQYKTASVNDIGYKFYTLHVSGKKYNPKVHKLVLSTFNPSGYNKITNECDHINNDKNNNNINNLRWCTRSQNQLERKGWSKTGEKLIYNHRNGYLITIKRNDKRNYIGCAKTLEQAIAIRNQYLLENNLQIY